MQRRNWNEVFEYRNSATCHACSGLGHNGITWCPDCAGDGRNKIPRKPDVVCKLHDRRVVKIDEYFFEDGNWGPKTGQNVIVRACPVCMAVDRMSDEAEKYDPNLVAELLNRGAVCS